MSRGTKTPHVVLAAVRDDGHFKAVELHKRHDGIEIAWAKCMSAEEGDWEAFAGRCGLAVDSKTGAPASDGHSTAVIGVDSTAVAFYTINAPNVGKEETAAIVRMQAESLLPLPASQIEVAWRAMPSTNGTADITLAAARTDYLRRFCEDVRSFGPQTVIPACEGLARTWHELFSERDRQAVIVSINAQNTQVCQAVQGHVAKAAVLDIGMNDLSVVDRAAETPQAVEVVECFVQDMQTVLASFGWQASSPWPVFVLSDGSDRIDRIVAALAEAGISARTAAPRPQALGKPVGLSSQDLYAYRVPIGLALMTLDGTGGVLDLCRRINTEREKSKVKSARYSTTLAGLLVAIMLAAVVVTWYLVDVASARRLEALVSQSDFEQARQHRLLVKTIARHRPDLLGFLEDINAGDNNGIVLDSFHFKKGQLASVTGLAGNAEQMWQYQQNLLKQKSIEDVNISSQTNDSKTKKIKFTMVFNYKGFTKKTAAL